MKEKSTKREEQRMESRIDTTSLKDLPGAHQTEDMVMDRLIDTSLRPLILDFFNNLTAEQVKILRDGEPDTATKAMLADLMLEIILSVTKAMVKAFMTLDIESVQPKLNDALSQTFGEFLENPDEDKCKRWTTDLSAGLSSEISISFQHACSSASSAPSEPSQPTFRHFTYPQTLNKIIGDACKTFKIFLGNMKQACSRQSNSRLEDVELEKMDDEEDIRVPSEDSFGIKTTKAACDIIKNNMSNIMENLLSDIPDEDYEQLQAETSEEILEISKSIAETISSMGVTDAAALRQKCHLKTVREKISKFFRKSFLKARLQSMVAKLRSKFDLDSTVACTDSLGSLAESVESLLLASMFSIPSDRVLIFTEQLSSLLYNYITNGTTLIPRSLRASLPMSHTDMYEEIRKKAWIFILVISWFQQTQAGKHSDSVIRALTGNESQATTGQPQPQGTEEPVTKQYPEESKEKDKEIVKILIGKLVTRIFKEIKMDFYFGAQEANETLFEIVWAKVEGTTLINEAVLDLDKAIFKYLKKKCGPAENILMSISLEDTEFANLFGRAINKHLTRPKKSAIGRFFSAVGKGFRKVFFS